MANKFSLWIWITYLFTFYELLHFLFTAFFQPITFIAGNKFFIPPFSFEIADLLQDSERLPVDRLSASHPWEQVSFFFRQSFCFNFVLLILGKLEKKKERLQSHIWWDPIRQLHSRNVTYTFREEDWRRRSAHWSTVTWSLLDTHMLSFLLRREQQ